MQVLLSHHKPKLLATFKKMQFTLQKCCCIQLQLLLILFGKYNRVSHIKKGISSVGVVNKYKMHD
jgi:hypothetical protein